jgi:hypothetical protein
MMYCSCYWFLTDFETDFKQGLSIMTLLEKLSINRKITAFFVDGSSKMNLGVKSVVDLLNGTDRVPVQIVPLKRAERLLQNVAESAGRTVHKVEDGVFLVQPDVEVSEPESAPEVVCSDPEPVAEVVQPKPVKTVKIARAAGGVERKYANLTKIFFNGSPMGQVLSIYKTRETNPAKWADYRAAIANGDCVLPSGPFSKSVAEKMNALGFNVLE